jgi:hypothetical protein
LSTSTPRRRRQTSTVVLVALVALVSFFLTACTKTYASASDEFTCVYSGDETQGKKLIGQIAPGQSAEYDDQSEIVKIPTSNRFLMASKDDNKRDPLAPKFYSFNAGQQPVQLEGQLRFRFNLPTACDWYAKHGRRNLNGQTDLGFNQRGAQAVNYGWFKFLAENPADVIQQVIQKVGGDTKYSWINLYDNYRLGTDDLGQPKPNVNPGPYANDQFGLELGRLVDDQLTSSLGGRYFCGIDPKRTELIDKDIDQTNKNTDRETCPTLTFDVHTPVMPEHHELVDERERASTLKAQLDATQSEGALLEAQKGAVAKAEKARQDQLQQQLVTAGLEEKLARIKAEAAAAQCLVLAEQGLDCDGKRPSVIIGGQPVK